MRGNTMAWGVAAAVTALTMTLGGCTSKGAEADEARSGKSSESAAAGASVGDTSGARPIVVPSEQLERLHVEPVTRTSFRPTIQVTGTVQFNADVSTQVISPISGPVMRILEDVGAEVHRGQPLALVSSPDFATTIADFRKAQAAYVQAKRVADQDEQLWKNDAIAKRDLEQAQTDAAAAGADRDAALQQLRALGVDEASIAALRDGKDIPELQGAIRAPIGGTVVERLINPGQLLQAGSTPAFTVADLATMWVQANVFESDLASVQIGDRAEVTTPASPNPFVGKVTYISALVDPATKATAVRVLVPNTRRLLKKDMYVQVAIHGSRERNGLLVPVTSVLRDDDNLPFVFVQRTGASANTFGRRQITIGSRVGDRYEVTAGLEAGERIISEGALFVQFAQTQ
ncbi:MAG TPA: efflux RND transporter periplasmic adaptor subunit [Gemmatimonadaceae bacterium]|nr:efflux RND transporter periplasmic adaptor subunit [Gemmatimonadaceae bacterium]